MIMGYISCVLPMWVSVDGNIVVVLSIEADICPESSSLLYLCHVGVSRFVRLDFLWGMCSRYDTSQLQMCVVILACTIGWC